MRIKASEIPSLIPHSDRIREKSDAGDGSESFQRQNHDRPKKENPSHERKIEVTDDEVYQAIEVFEQQKQAEGLHVVSEGNGLGLRVLLKDKEGKLIRQMSGEEFVDLKKTLENHLPVIGKMLDQKV